MKKGLFGIVLALGLATITPIITSCNKVEDENQSYINQMVLPENVTYEGHNFLDYGIGEVEFKKHIDGDTTHFYQKEEARRVVKVRYFGVDTPESTGQIEPWGKEASNFTKEKIANAKTIVLTSDTNEIGKAAQTDSTGTRFKGLVWISEKENAAPSELRCLNLMLTVYGWSTSKGMEGSQWAGLFNDADIHAQETKQGMHEADEPPGWKEIYGKPVETTLQELADAYNEDYVETSWNGSFIKVRGVVTKLVGTYDAYITTTGDDGQMYGLYVFAGYKTYVPLITLGNELEIIGNYTIFGGNPQMTNVTYSSLLPGKNDMKVISRDNTVEIKKAEVDDVVNRLTLNTVHYFENLTVYGGYTEIDSTTQKASGALTLRCHYCDDQSKNISVRIPDDVWAEIDGVRVTKWETFEGRTIDLIGAVTFFTSDEEDEEGNKEV